MRERQFKALKGSFHEMVFLVFIVVGVMLTITDVLIVEQANKTREVCQDV